MKQTQWILLGLLTLGFSAAATDFSVSKSNEKYIPCFSENGKVLLMPSPEGLWSISAHWENDWPADWKYAQADRFEKNGDWTILYGSIQLPEGTWNLRDAYRAEGDRVKCIRRFEWTGKETLKEVTLSVKWQTPSYTDRVMLPGVINYGNPSGYKHGGWMPTFDKKVAPEAMFEEHHFPMPFVSAEVETDGTLYGVALHTLPTLVPESNIPDMWWSLGTIALEDSTQLTLLSGPVAWNGKRSFAKALQRVPMKYGDTWMNVEPGAIIEKTFYVETYPVKQRGSGFIHSVDTSMDIFKPYYVEYMPSFSEIIHEKYRFACKRYFENDKGAGFCMYPENYGPHYVFGWCGQAAAPGYALQRLKPFLDDSKVDEKIQKSLDKLSEAPFNESGFLIHYVVNDDRWEGQDPLSQGQGMNNVAKAIIAAKEGKSQYDTSKWETFLRKACDCHAKRILSDDWNPVSTNEGFLISPLCIASELYNEPLYRQAALKAADYYAKRHLSMDEPYWGGTLDATGEDKEGAWAAFQGFLAVYELTHEAKYLAYAEHAAYNALCYTVVWDIPMPASRMGNHAFKSRGWTAVSPQNMHLDVFGVMYTPHLYKLGVYLNKESLKRVAILMYRSCGQMMDPFGSQGEQLQHTNFAQHGNMSNIYKFRGGYAEGWTVFWITAHFLNAAADFMEIDPELLK